MQFRCNNGAIIQQYQIYDTAVLLHKMMIPDNRSNCSEKWYFQGERKSTKQIYVMYLSLRCFYIMYLTCTLTMQYQVLISHLSLRSIYTLIFQRMFEPSPDVQGVQGSSPWWCTNSKATIQRIVVLLFLHIDQGREPERASALSENVRWTFEQPMGQGDRTGSRRPASCAADC